jgi:hypothetical protein
MTTLGTHLRPERGRPAVQTQTGHPPSSVQERYGYPTRSITFFIRFEALTAVTMKCTAFWVVKLRSSVKVLRRFGGTHCFHQAACILLAFAWLTLRFWRWRRCVPRKGSWAQTKLHGVTIQKRWCTSFLPVIQWSILHVFCWRLFLSS